MNRPESKCGAMRTAESHKMKRQTIQLMILAVLLPVALYGKESVCDLFKDLKAADGRLLTITGELLLSKSLTGLGAADCDNRYLSSHYQWPVALSLRPTATVSAEKIQELEKAALEADRLRSEGKIVHASASFSGQIQLVSVGDSFPAELIFDSFENLKLEILPDPRSLSEN